MSDLPVDAHLLSEVTAAILRMEKVHESHPSPEVSIQCIERMEGKQELIKMGLVTSADLVRVDVTPAVRMFGELVCRSVKAYYGGGRPKAAVTFERGR